MYVWVVPFAESYGGEGSFHNLLMEQGQGQGLGRK